MIDALSSIETVSYTHLDVYKRQVWLEIWDFQTLRRELSASADCFRCKVGRDRRASGARGAASCSERSDAKQPGLQSSGLSASQSAHTPVRRV